MIGLQRDHEPKSIQPAPAAPFKYNCTLCWNGFHEEANKQEGKCHYDLDDEEKTGRNENDSRRNHVRLDDEDDDESLTNGDEQRRSAQKDKSIFFQASKSVEK